MKKYLLSFPYLPYLPIFLAPIILFAPVLFTGKALFWGTPSLQFVPWWAWTWQTLRSGHLPLWNPLLGMGAPLLANYQLALFYPPNWIFLLLAALGGIPTLAWGQALFIAAHLCWAGIGMVRLVRKIGLGVLSQTVSGLAFCLSGYLVGRAGFLSMTAAVAWLPWILLGVLNVISVREDLQAEIEPLSQNDNITLVYNKERHSARLRSTLILGIVIGLQLLAGHAQITWYTLCLAGIWGLYWLWRIEGVSHSHYSISPSKNNLSIWKAALRTGILLCVAVGIGVALAAVQLLPTVEYLHQSQRSVQVDYATALTYSFWPWRLIGLIAPDFFGNPSHGNYWGYGSYWEDAIYIGVLPLILAVTVVINFRKNKGQNSFKLFLLIIIFLGFILSIGKNSPIYPWLYHHIPSFALFKSPTRYTLWIVFALSMLAGLSVHSWHRPEGKGLYWTRLAAMGAFAVSLGSLLAWVVLRNSIDTQHLATMVQATCLAGLWALGTGILTLLVPIKDISQPHISEKWWKFGVVALVLVDLWVADWGLNPGINRSFYQSPILDNKPTLGSESLRTMLDGGRLYLSAASEYQLKFTQYFRSDTFYPGVDWGELRSVLLPNMNLLDELSTVNNFDPLVPGRYAFWMDALDKVDDVTRKGLLQMMNVRMIEKIDPASPSGVRFDTFNGENRIRWFPCGCGARDGEDAWNLLLSSLEGNSNESTTGEEVILEGGNILLNPLCYPDDTVDISIKGENPNRVALRVRSNYPGWLFMADTYYPGWNAWIDGQKVPVMHADYLFRAISMPAGDHLVVFVYQPISFYVGAIISAVSCLGLWLVFWYLRSL